MKKGNLTREQAVEICGEGVVAALDYENCDFTSRIGYNGSCQGDEEVEFSASVSCKDKDGNEFRLIAYYYQDAAAVDRCADDLACLDWTIEGYEII